MAAKRKTMLSKTMSSMNYVHEVRKLITKVFDPMGTGMCGTPMVETDKFRQGHLRIQCDIGESIQIQAKTTFDAIVLMMVRTVDKDQQSMANQVETHWREAYSLSSTANIIQNVTGWLSRARMEHDKITFRSQPRGFVFHSHGLGFVKITDPDWPIQFVAPLGGVVPRGGSRHSATLSQTAGAMASMGPSWVLDEDWTQEGRTLGTYRKLNDVISALRNGRDQAVNLGSGSL